MPPIESINRHQKAVVWYWTGEVDEYGRPKVQQPEEIQVRWESTQRDTQDGQGRKVSYEASVKYHKTIPINSLLWLGKQVDLNEENPTSGVMQVMSEEIVPDLKGRNTTYNYSLSRYQDTFPTVI